MKKNDSSNEAPKKKGGLFDELRVTVLVLLGIAAVIVGLYYFFHTVVLRGAKPVIYLYPTQTTEVRVSLEPDGGITCSYPRYETAWEVTATPDGTLYDGTGTAYNYLYWEADLNMEPDFSRGFCVAGEDTAAFLETALSKLGLTRREANEFIVYWLPLMQDNAYNLISFQTEHYTACAKLDVTPAPDTLIRVFMAYRPLQSAVELTRQTLEAPAREGFTVVEWGGCECP